MDGRRESRIGVVKVDILCDELGEDVGVYGLIYLPGLDLSHRWWLWESYE